MLRPHLAVWEDQMHECPACGREYRSQKAAERCPTDGCGMPDP